MNTSEGPLYSYDSSVPPLDQGDDLPPCSELRKQFAEGNYNPSVTVESFIPDKTEMGFHGDDRSFIDSPSNPAIGTTSRVSVTSDFHNGAFADRVDPTKSIWPFSQPATGWADVGSLNRSDGNVLEMIVHYSATNPYGPRNDMVMMGFDIRASVGLTFDLNTGILSGEITRSSFPALQIFHDGKSIYEGDASNLGAFGLPFDTEGKINGVQICDPSK